MRVDLEPKDDFMEIEFNGQKCLIKDLKDLVYTDIDGVPNGERIVRGLPLLDHKTGKPIKVYSDKDKDKENTFELTKALIMSLPNLYALTPASREEILDIEIKLKIRFSNEYRAYLEFFGAIMADGIELSGFAKSSHRSVVFLTIEEKENNPQVPSHWYVIEKKFVEGIVIWQNHLGNIYLTQSGGEPVKIATSMYEYLLNRVK